MKTTGIKAIMYLRVAIDVKLVSLRSVSLLHERNIDGMSPCDGT